MISVATGGAVDAAAQAGGDEAQLPVVHIHTALPCNAPGIDAEGVALIDVVVQHGGQQIVGRADGVEVAGKVEVDVLHGHHLGIAAAGGAALDAEHRPQRRLPQRHHGLLAKTPQGVGKADGGGGFALSGGGRIDGGDQDQLAVVSLFLTQKPGVHLSLVTAVRFQIRLIHARFTGDVGDGAQGGGLRDLNIRFVSHRGILSFKKRPWGIGILLFI